MVASTARTALAPSPPWQTARKVAAALAFWISISWTPRHASAWVMVPRPLARPTRPPRGGTTRATSRSGSPFLSKSSSRASSASYSSHDRKSRTRMSSSQTPVANDGSSVATASGDGLEARPAGVPLLRSLYDAPPPLTAKDENDPANTANSTTGNEKEDTVSSNAGWATEVTTGTLPAEDGSAHVLYYEVHRRFRREVKEETEHQRHSPSLTGLFLHGGPGAGCFPNHVRFFAPELYGTVILFDQRGCGRSTPLGETMNNTLEVLVEDVERLRLRVLRQEEAAVPPWDVILGGSWGVTLAMAYAHRYPGHVRAMVLRGVCLFRKREIDWLFGDPPSSGEPHGAAGKGGGAARTSNLRSLLGASKTALSPRAVRTVNDSSAQTATEPTVTTELSASSAAQKTAAQIFPKGWTEFHKGSNIGRPKIRAEQTDLKNHQNPRSVLHKYYQYLLGVDPALRVQAVKAWFRWEMGIYSSGFPDEGHEGATLNKAQDMLSKNNHTVLVWHPATESWAYEDARVRTNHSFESVDVDPSAVAEEMVQLLRRFSSSPSFSESTQSHTPAEYEMRPMPIHPMVASSNKPMPAPKTNRNNGGNKTFDPTTYIPAQPMLTCYYSSNDEYCIGPYTAFLSLAPPSAMPLSSWYSSQLPPQLPQSSSSAVLLSADSSITPAFPLPPTIAIQGGNDAICPPDTSLDLHHVWRELELRVVLCGGHSMYDPVVAGEIVKALDRFGRDLLGDTVAVGDAA